MKLIDLIEDTSLEDINERKRIKLVYRLLKKGTVPWAVNPFIKIEYVLPDEFKLVKLSFGPKDEYSLCLNRNDIKYYKRDKNGDLIQLDLSPRESYHYYTSIEKKFEAEDIHTYFHIATNPQY